MDFSQIFSRYAFLGTGPCPGEERVQAEYEQQEELEHCKSELQELFNDGSEILATQNRTRILFEFFFENFLKFSKTFRSFRSFEKFSRNRTFNRSR